VIPWALQGAGKHLLYLSLSLPPPHSWTHEKEIVEVSLCGNSTTSVLVFYLSCRKLSQPDDQKKVKWEEYFVPKFLSFFFKGKFVNLLD
jgi:hypothetical protein